MQTPTCPAPGAASAGSSQPVRLPTIKREPFFNELKRMWPKKPLPYSELKASERCQANKKIRKVLLPIWLAATFAVGFLSVKFIGLSSACVGISSVSLAFVILYHIVREPPKARCEMRR